MAQEESDRKQEARDGNLIVAKIDARDVTIDDLTALARATGNLEQLKNNPSEFLGFYALSTRLVSYAIANQIDKQANIGLTIDTQQRQVLADAAIDWYSRKVIVTRSEIAAYYQSHIGAFSDKSAPGASPEPLSKVSEKIRMILQGQETEKWLKGLIKKP